MKKHGALSWHGIASKSIEINGALTVRERSSRHTAWSRRRFMALGAGAALITGVTDADAAAQQYTAEHYVRFDGDIEACSPAPIPVAGDPNLGGLHIWLPVAGVEPSAIFDFRGQVGVADISGMGTLTDTVTGARSRLPFLADIRYMTGAYVGVDEKRHHGTFGFA
jgi:hypothetical protein